MRIRELHLKHFGKFTDKKIVLNEGMNLFYGENETGKTTIHTFIKSMLFGMERGRGRASVNDTFSIYEPWENPNYYAGTLRFESGGKQFLLERTFDKYNKSARLICEDDGEEFSLEHGDLEMILGGLTASNYDNTISVAQMKVETNQSLAAELQNFATNYYATGNSDIDLDGALQLLAKKRKEVEKEIRTALAEKQKKRSVMEQETAYVWRDIHKLEEEIEEVEKQIEVQKESREEQEGLPTKRWRIHPGIVAGMLIALVISFVAFPKPWNYLITIVLALGEGLFTWNRMKDGKKKPQEEILKEVDDSLNKLQWKKERLQSELKEKQILYGNIQEQLEELDEMGDVYKRQDDKKKALELAESRLIELSKGVHKELSLVLNKRASEILSEITDGKYNMLLIDEKLKMQLYTGERKISLEQVSRGTIEQIYFALRMAASELLHEESYPIILDDTFVYYDDVRLEHTLRWLKKQDKQILLFTCHKREEEIWNRIG